MRIEYDPDVDALYIMLREVQPKDSMDIEEGVTVDLDEDGHIVGLEVLDAKERLGAAGLANITIETLPVDEKVAPK